MIDILKYTGLCLLTSVALMILFRAIFKNSVLSKILNALILFAAYTSLATYITILYGFINLLWLVPVGFLTLILLIKSQRNKILKPLNEISHNIYQLSKGNVTITFADQETENLPQELVNLSISATKQWQMQKNAIDFANELSNNNFTNIFEAASEKDELGKALLSMRKNLKKNMEDEENRKKENDKNNWITNGVAMFSNILRTSGKSSTELGYLIVENIVEYLKANLVGIFIFVDAAENPYLELVASYAYDRRKYLKKHIALGEGLVGMCAVEKKVTYLNNLPDGYIEINSGLGGSSPKHLLLIPLMAENKLFGVLEVAAFKAFEKHEILFMEKVAENISASMYSVKITEKTNELLHKSNIDSTEMKIQEEKLLSKINEQDGQLQYSKIETINLNNEIKQLNDTIKDLRIKLHNSLAENKQILNNDNQYIDEYLN